MPKKSKKSKSLYDANGRWSEEHYAIKGALRRVYRQHPAHKESHTRARVELPPKILKDGKTGKVNQIFYKCAECGLLFKQKNVVPDHIESVVPLWKTDTECTPNELVERMFVNVDQLQILCNTKIKDLKPGEPRSCHAIKSREENWIRDRMMEFFRRMGIDDFEERRQIFLVRLPLIQNEYQEFLEAEKRELAAKAERKRLKELNRKPKKQK